jgi:hypothetical protein
VRNNGAFLVEKENPGLLLAQDELKDKERKESGGI